MAFKWRRSKKPIERVLNDDEGNEARIWVVKFSEKDIRAREKFLGEPVSADEGNTRQSRSNRGRGTQSIQIQRIRQFNFERALKDWDFVYPDTYWDETEEIEKSHPKAGQKVPVSREAIEEMDASISEQINDILNEINEPPAELPEVRDEEGRVVEEAVESPLERNSVAS